jgi:hypothetical protein
VSDLASRLRERHWAKVVSSWCYDTQDVRDFEVCNQDGQEWPCFTERMIRETRSGQ